MGASMENFKSQEKRRAERKESLNGLVSSLLKTVGKRKEDIDKFRANSNSNCVQSQSKFIDRYYTSYF